MNGHDAEMEATKRRCLQREFEDFESDGLIRAASHCEFWGTSAEAAQDTPLGAVFRRLACDFPDHVHDNNVVFYLTEHGSLRQLLLACSHFEHASDDDVARLVRFMDWTTGLLTDNGHARVELLDGIGEQVILSFHDPRAEIVDWLKINACRTSPSSLES